MRQWNKSFLAVAAAAVVLTSANSAWAVITSGPGGQGVLVGNSSLFGDLDYSDTITQTDQGGSPGRPPTAAVQVPPAYNIENAYGNRHRVISIGSGFSFAADPPALGLVNGVPNYSGASGSGSEMGFTQTGGGIDYGIIYHGIRDIYTVQVDAVQTPDRIDVSSGASVGIFARESLSVFFRGDGGGNASLFNGAVDTPIRGQPGFESFNTGIPGSGQWHNYAVRYDRENKTVELLVDEVSKVQIDLTTFAGGIYQNFSGNMVGAGGAGGNRTWTDNFQVGGNGPAATLPDRSLGAVPSGLLSYWDFDETDAGLDIAVDRAGLNDGFFTGTAVRAPGLVGLGSAEFHDAGGDGVNVNMGTGNGLRATTGLTVEMLFTTTYNGSDQAEFFRKEDGGNRILLSFQSDANTASGTTNVGTDGFPSISLGLNTAGYKEMDVALDGLDGRPTLAQLADGGIHHLVATYDSVSGMKSMYIDGALIGQNNFGIAPGTLIVSGGNASGFIGSDRGGEPFPGTIDEVAIWDRALSPSEVAFHYANSSNGQNYFVPEPGTFVLAGLGLLGMLAVARKRK